MEKPIVMRGLSEDKVASGFTLFRVQPNKISEPIKNPVIALYFFDIAVIQSPTRWIICKSYIIDFVSASFSYAANRNGRRF